MLWEGALDEGKELQPYAVLCWKCFHLGKEGVAIKSWAQFA